jgi:hypothetical protein
MNTHKATDLPSGSVGLTGNETDNVEVGEAIFHWCL